MTILELGALGELLGSIAVLATLVYLSVQVRQNTRSMEESKKLALAQTYQMRADALQMMLVQAADSKYIGPIITRLTSAGLLGNEPRRGYSITEAGKERASQL